MSAVDLAETVEVLCHQMFYRAVGMEEAGCKKRQRGGQGWQGWQSGALCALLWASSVMKVGFRDHCETSEATPTHQALTSIYTGMS